MKQKKYMEIYKTVKQRIINSEYKTGSKLPSKRVMADMFGCSTVTVETAYRCLSDEGYIISKERCGYIVSAHAGDLLIANKSGGMSIKHLDEKSEALPETDFEYSVWFRTVRKVITDYGERLFVKSPNMGCAVLRNAISDYLLRYRGMYAQPERILISSGSERLYEIAVRILGTDKIYGIEDPSYPQIEAVYTGVGIKVKKLKMGKKGIMTKCINNSDFNVLHVTPFRSYPSGVTADINKRMEYLNWSSANHGYIIEDDFNSEFFIPGNPIDSLYSLDKTDSVIYLNTFSKSLSASVRIGYMIIPHQFMDRYYEKLSMYSCSVPVLDQYILAEFITSGSFERHLNRMRRKMKEL